MVDFNSVCHPCELISLYCSQIFDVFWAVFGEKDPFRIKDSKNTQIGAKNTPPWFSVKFRPNQWENAKESIFTAKSNRFTHEPSLQGGDSILVLWSKMRPSPSLHVEQCLLVIYTSRLQQHFALKKRNALLMSEIHTQPQAKWVAIQ